MRLSLLSLPLALALVGCASHGEAYRFSSPMLGMAQVPPPSLDHPLTPGRTDRTPERVASPSRHADPIRVASAPAIREASAAAAAEIAATPNAQPAARAELPAPNALPSDAPRPTVRTPTDLRLLTGYRDKRDQLVAALDLAHQIGTSVAFEPVAAVGTMVDGVSPGDNLVAWAGRDNRLADYTVDPQPGDLLVFDRVENDRTSDCIGLVIARDDRNVTEFLYLGGGVYRRAFIDVSRPAMRRDKQRRVVNSFMRNGKRWPAKGMHYLSGELLGHIIRAR